MTENSPKNFTPRAPIVVVLGHVDHGKTSLLDYIKKSNIAAKESGGITQHIGAYEIEYKGKKISFLDTPGHEAFSAMRSRGANAADIAILVVAADEGVKPQTKEAINVIKNSKIPFIVAINKIDREGAIPEKVKHELMKYDIIVESLGGETASVNTSAKSGAGIDELLDLILLMGEINELKGHPEKPAEGIVIEAYLDKKRGPNATLLVLDGTLKVGDFVATKTAFGKIKILEDFQGDVMKKAIPSQPCLVIGFENVPGVGEEFSVFESAEKAQEYVKENSTRRHGPKALDLKEGQKALNLILKVDVAGSIEAIEKILEQLPQEEIVLNILKAEVGDITEKDIDLAVSANARIIVFRVKVPPMIQRLSEDEKVRMASFDIIYNLAQGVRAWQQELIKPKAVRVDYGRLRILAVFWTEGSRQIVGGRVTDGEIKKGLQLEVYRGDEMIGKGRNLSLQRNKKDIDSASKRDEVAFLFEGDCRIQEDDTIVFYGIQS